MGQLVSSMGANSSGPKWELERQLAVLNSQFNKRVLIDLFIWNDDQNSSQHVIYVCNSLGESGWGTGSAGRERQGETPGWWLGRSVSSVHVFPAHSLVCTVSCTSRETGPVLSHLACLLPIVRVLAPGQEACGSRRRKVREAYFR